MKIQAARNSGGGTLAKDTAWLSKFGRVLSLRNRFDLVQGLLYVN